jgi:WD40-like Beta Propeller Repeat
MLNRSRSMVSTRRASSLALWLSVSGALASACGSNGGATGGALSAGTGGAGGKAPTGSTATGDDVGVGVGVGGSAAQGPFTDFPAAPILDMPAGGAATPADAATLFGDAGSGDATGGPCMVEPSPGTLYPNNWLRPRFRWSAPQGQNLFEIRITSTNEINDLVVYTTATSWKMPADMWHLLSLHMPDQSLTVTVRGATLSGGKLMGKPAVGTSGDIRIAPAAASGSIVYWRTIKATNSGELKGFAVGDESVVTALRSDEVKVKIKDTPVTCIGCHTSTPDGKYAAVKTLGVINGGALGSVAPGSTGQPPPFWTKASMDAMADSAFGIPTFSKAHWADGDYTLVTSWGTGKNTKLIWFDLQANASGEGTSFGYIARDGDARGVVMPAWSHDGNTVVYTSTDEAIDGRPSVAQTDLFTVPYAAKKGGAAKGIPGASDPAYNEYYPALSPDDKLVAFNRVPAGKDTYNQPLAEVFVIPTAGGTATRLDANDAPACSGEKSPGLTNSWPKWAPGSTTVGDRTFYWLTFSSVRGGGNPQLYISAVVVQGGKVTTYPALYLWNQPSDEANHTPAWDVFDIPPVVK